MCRRARHQWQGLGRDGEGEDVDVQGRGGKRSGPPLRECRQSKPPRLWVQDVEARQHLQARACREPLHRGEETGGGARQRMRLGPVADAAVRRQRPQEDQGQEQAGSAVQGGEGRVQDDNQQLLETARGW